MSLYHPQPGVLIAKGSAIPNKIVTANQDAQTKVQITQPLNVTVQQRNVVIVEKNIHQPSKISKGKRNS